MMRTGSTNATPLLQLSLLEILYAEEFITILHDGCPEFGAVIPLFYRGVCGLCD